MAGFDDLQLPLTLNEQKLEAEVRARIAGDNAIRAEYKADTLPLKISTTLEDFNDAVPPLNFEEGDTFQKIYALSATAENRPALQTGSPATVHTFVNCAEAGLCSIMQYAFDYSGTQYKRSGVSIDGVITWNSWKKEVDETVLNGALTDVQTILRLNSTSKGQKISIPLSTLKGTTLLCMTWGYTSSYANTSLIQIVYDWNGWHFKVIDINVTASWLTAPTVAINNSTLEVTQNYADGTVVQVFKIA